MAADVVVVGGGFIGLLAAYRLQRSGLKVVVVGGESPRLGASWGNAGLIHQGSTTAVPEILGFWRVVRLALRRGSYISSNPWIALRESLPGGWIWRYARSLERGSIARRGEILAGMSQEGKRVWLELIREEELDSELTERGSIEAFFSEELYKLESRVVADEAARLGYRIQTLDGERCRELEPLLRENVAGGIHYIDDVWINPSKTLESLAMVLQRMDVKLIWERAGPVKLIDDGVRIASRSGEIRAERAVIAAGAWTKKILESFRINIPLIAGRGYLAVSEPVRERVTRPIFYADEKIVISQTRDGNMRFTSYFELNSPDAPIDRAKIVSMVRKAREAIVLEKYPEIIDEWVGSRPCMPDGLPLIGKIDERGRVIIATGHCRLGLTLAPSTARLVEELIAGREPSELRYFSPSRFSRRSSA